MQGEELKKAMDNGFDAMEGTISGANVECPVCGQVTKTKQLRKIAQDGKMEERMIAAIFHNPHETGKKFRLASKDDELIFRQAAAQLKQKIADWPNIETPLPEETIPPMSGKFNVISYGISEWKDLFLPRQQLALVTFMEAISDSFDTIKEDSDSILQQNTALSFESHKMAKAITGYLSLIFGRLLDYFTTLCLWVASGEFVAHTFSRQSLPMAWDYCEVNPFSKSTGDWNSAVGWVLRFILNNSHTNISKIAVNQSSATELQYKDNSFDAILTDPPYYYNVTYADLSDFFYVWFKRMVGEIFPSLFSTPLSPKSKEIIEGAFWDKRRYKHKNADFFESMLGESFKEMYRVIKPGGIATIVYAHKTTEGWETMLNALIKAGFVVTASWPIHTEREGKLGWGKSGYLASSIYMVCRKVNRKEVGFYNEIKPQIKERVEQKLEQFWIEGIVGGDFFISAIGPGMEIFSRYEKVEKLSGDQVTTKELLEYIRSVSTDFIVRQLLEDVSSAQIDNASEFYLAYRWTYMDNTVDYDDARKLASASGFSLEDHWDTDDFIYKHGSSISVWGPQKRKEIKNIDNMVDVMHKCVLLWEQGKRNEITSLLEETSYKDKPAFKQFCQAVAESLVNGNKEKQLLEGFLMSIDAYTRGKVKKHKDQTDLEQYGGE